MSRLARPYAKALLNVAGSLEQATAVRDQLAAFAGVLADVPALGEAIANPALPLPAKQRVVEQVIARLALAPLAVRLVGALVSRHRLGRLPEIVAELTELLNARQGIAVAEVTTAEPLADDERQQLQSVLERKVGKRLQLHCTVEPELLAGFVARIDSQLFDGSLRGQLDRLAKELAEA